MSVVPLLIAGLMEKDMPEDNSGNLVPQTENMVDPVLASAQKVTAGSKDTDASITVKQGQMYAVTSLLGAHVFGIATTATAANCIWAAAAGQTIIIRVPIGYTTLHYQTPSNTRTFYIREVAD